MNRRLTIEHREVEFVPKELEDGVLYVSARFNTASHLCCCGCGNKVVTPLNPSKWRFVDHGSTVSLFPSIGLGVLACKSHYLIRHSKIDWLPPISDAQTRRAQRADHYASQVYTGEIKLPPTQAPTSPPSAHGWLKRFGRWLGSFLR